MDLQKLKKDLMAKGISVVASTNEITAGLAWSVEGIEKVPRLGELLFYKVNGVEYGVKPSKGNKHDIHWYYDQLKTGMKGARGYSAGLTQFLNVWVKKGELVIVYKGGKVVESEFKGEVCTASPQLVSETGVANLLYDMKIKANKWNHGATGICWDVVLNGNKVLVIEYLEDEGTANLTYRNGSTKKDIKDIKTIADLKDKVEKYLSKINSDKVTSDVGFSLEDISEMLNGLGIETKRSMKISYGPSLKWNDKFLVSKFRDKPVAYVFNLKNSSEEPKECDSLEEVKEEVIKQLKNVGVMVTADLEEGENPETEILAFIDDVNGLTIGGKRVFNAEKKGDDIVINLLLKHFETPDMNRLNELVEDKLEVLFPITQKWMDADKGRTFGNTKKAGDITMYAEEFSPSEFSDQLVIEDCSKIDWSDLPSELNHIYKVLERDCNALETKLFKVTADVCEVKETLGELNEENFEGINKEHDRLMYIKVTPEQFLQLWKTSPNFNGSQLQKIVYGFKLALRTLNSKFENKGILIECFYKKKDGKGYIRVEYDKDLYIIYVSRSDIDGEIKVITRKMRKVIPTKNFNILSTSVGSLAFERSALPSGFKPIWEEVSQPKT